jgi:hypothetical protein
MVFSSNSSFSIQYEASGKIFQTIFKNRSGRKRNVRGDGLPVKLRSEQMPANKEMVVNPDFLVNLMRLAKRLI